jgi:DNA (cytosine-5)-methyltransferase 1
MDFESETLVTHALRGEGFDASKDGTGRGTPLVPMCLPILEVGARTGVSTTDIRAGSGIGESADLMFTLQAGKQHGVLSFHGSQDPCISEHVTHPVGRNQGQETCIAFDLRGREGGAMAEPTDVASPRSASGGSSRTYVGVRRLMPVECERLQGMADGYTAVEYNGELAKDGPRYKAIGNSMAVPVLSWILRRISCQQDQS